MWFNMENKENRVTGVNVDELNAYFRTGNSNNRFEYKDKSLLAKMGFQDGQLKTPEHDKMIDILMDDAVLSKIANKVMNIEKKDFEFNSNDRWTKKEEYVIKSHNGYIIGYIDLLSTIKKTIKYYEENGNCEYKEYYCDNPYLYCSGCSDDIKKVCKVSNYSGKCNNKSVIGSRCHKYEDIKICKFTNPNECLHYKNTRLEKYCNIAMFIEAKPVIDSIGELIRQINTYRESIGTIINEYNYYSQNAHKNDYFKNEYEKRNMCVNDSFRNSSLCFVVVTPNTDDRQRKRLKESNIKLIDMKELI